MDVIATRTVKAAADVAHLMEETVGGAQKDAKISKDAVMSDTERANQINLIMAMTALPAAEPIRSSIASTAASSDSAMCTRSTPA